MVMKRKVRIAEVYNVTRGTNYQEQRQSSLSHPDESVVALKAELMNWCISNF